MRDAARMFLYLLGASLGTISVGAKYRAIRRVQPDDAPGLVPNFDRRSVQVVLASIVSCLLVIVAHNDVRRSRDVAALIQHIHPFAGGAGLMERCRRVRGR